MKENDNERSLSSASVRVEYNGPLPPAAELKRYNEIQNGFADRILKLAENEAEFRHKLNQDFLNKDFVYKTRGQLFALVIAIFALIVSAICAIFGNEWAASIIGGLDIVGLISVFVVNKFVPNDNIDDVENSN